MMQLKKRLCCIDWDDTFFPSSYYLKDDSFISLYENGINSTETEKTQNIKIELRYLDIKTTYLLERLSENSDICIITNAERMWFLFCMTLLPKVNYFLSYNNIPVYFARETFGTSKIEYKDWKVYSLYQHLSYFQNHKWTEMVYLGDQDVDQYVCETAINKKLFKHVLFILFSKEPTYEHILSELKYVEDKIIHFEFEINDPNPRIQINYQYV